MPRPTPGVGEGLVSRPEQEVPSPARRRLDSPLLTGLLALAAALMFVLGHLALHGGDVTVFIGAGDRMTEGTRTPEPLTIQRDSPGYDGQYFYRLALDPFPVTRTAYGVTLDCPPYRAQRVLYPLAARLLACGAAALIPWALIAVNLLAFGGIGFIAGRLARGFGYHALAGLGLALYPGLLLSVARDLAEPLAAFFLLWSLWLLTRARYGVAGLALAAAVLTKETALFVAAGVIAGWAANRFRNRAAPLAQLAAGLVPVVVYAGWYAFLVWRWRALPVPDGPVFHPPFSGLWSAVRAGGGGEALYAAELAFLALVAGAGLFALWRAPVASSLKISLVVYLAFATLWGGIFWREDWSFLRAFTECYLLGGVILLADRKPLAAGVFGAAALLWLVLFVNRL